MSIELILFIAMVGVFIISCFALKLPVSIAMVLSAIAGTLISGNGIPIRHLVEGSFAYIDTILVISTAMIFMKIIQEIGTLNSLTASILKKFHKTPVVLLILLMLISMFPGMITGSSTASVLTAGSIVAPIFMILGIPALETAAIIAIGGLCGMIAPPVNVPAMIIGGGIDMPYVGFTIPLLILTIPVAIFSVLYLGLKYTKNIDYNLVKEKVEVENTGIKLYIPIIVVVALMVADKVFPRAFGLGMPLIFIIGSIIGIICGKKVDVLRVSKEAINQCLPVLGILMGVGMFIQTMTLTGVRGFVVVRSLSLPETLLFAAMAITIPLFGAVSSFGASSVLGVPFLMAFLSYNQIITASSISFVAALGDLMPPTALAGIFAAQVVGLENYTPVLKKCIVPGIVIILYSIFIILFSKQIGAIIF
ncbi:MAG: TRAP transporter large permease subunit [Fusobacterium gastrosuis]|uniref:TRAP transporter large permease subunit n=1 Tax=Fusobacterium TaxID=848 RepID=UPI001F4FB7A4|nr:MULTISPECIES: TRAP transporter large permease subunit [Fusobacterium]MDD7392769.1 TRAP transporter large permease subunit [Fusobacteriaceae bacterium]MCI5725174.1 TRAP transporter large permease subunit [Fusobacterium sp.]MDD7410671.1 TRAP transporter large permease subunit [Fusobacteriaceae bacterium]MDY4010923.1 TRAP transporter large permease subunit [Fusobacterium gastrosuis]MDY5305124.1 TRAP transporter large permease subunit [Fusobacterium gastrosuis]